MTPGTPTTRPKEQASSTAGPPARESWQRQWVEPVVVGPIISSLVIALFGVGVVAFQSLKDDITALKDDIRATETRLGEALQDLRAEFKADNANLRAELKADNRALSDKLDRVLENLRR